MNCQIFLRRLDRYLDGDLPAHDRRAFEEHSVICPTCQVCLTRERTLRESLRALPVPSMRDGFAKQAITAAVETEKSSRRGFRHTMVGVAIAASLFAGIAIGVSVQRQVASPSVPMVQLMQGQDTIRLVFTATEPVDNVRFTVVLPNGVEIAGHPGEREVVWRGQLKQGRNLLNLPLVAEQTANNGVLRAEVQYRHYAKEVRVGLQIAASPKLSKT